MVHFGSAQKSGGDPSSAGMWSYRFLGQLQQKRKTEPDLDILPPTKMHITEEKMVSQLKGIHLSNDYTSHGAPTPRELELEECIKSKLDGEGCLPSLLVCDEIRALQNSMDPILPKSLMEKYERPSTALVLWQPPSRDVARNIAAAIQFKMEQSTRSFGSQEVPDVEMNEDDDNNNGSANANMNGPIV